MSGLNFTPVFSVFGDKRVVYGTVTASGVTSGSCETGLDYIDAGTVTPLSTTTTVYGRQVAFNKESGGTAVNGALLIKSCVAGDTWSVVLVGK